MKNRYVDQLNMFDEVIFYSDDNFEAFEEDVPDYATTLTAFKAKVASIKNTDQVVQQPTKGFAGNKKSLKKLVCKEAASITKAIRAYASKNDVPELLGEFQYSRSELVKKRDNRLPQVLRNIQATANTLISVTPPAPNPLAGSKIDTARMAAFEALISQYETAAPTPRNAIVGRKTGNQQLGVLFHDANVILKDQLDGLAEQASNSFYQGYLNARIIVDSVTSHTKISGNVTGFSTGVPLVGATVKAQNELTVTRTTTDENGHYILYTPKFRLEHTVTAEMPGYQTEQLPGIQVRLGKTTTKDVVMNPVS